MRFGAGSRPSCTLLPSPRVSAEGLKPPVQQDPRGPRPRPQRSCPRGIDPWRELGGGGVWHGRFRIVPPIAGELFSVKRCSEHRLCRLPAWQAPGGSSPPALDRDRDRDSSWRGLEGRTGSAGTRAQLGGVWDGGWSAQRGDVLLTPCPETSGCPDGRRGQGRAEGCDVARSGFLSPGLTPLPVSTSPPSLPVLRQGPAG